MKFEGFCQMELKLNNFHNKGNFDLDLLTPKT